MKFSEIVRAVITLATASEQARMIEGPDDDSPLLTSGGDPSSLKLRSAEERRLRDYLETQSPSVVYLLTALMYLGRGDFAAKSLLNQYREVRETFGEAKWAARQMLATMPLAQYLDEGLKKLAQTRVDIDRLLST